MDTKYQPVVHNRPSHARRGSGAPTPSPTRFLGREIGSKGYKINNLQAEIDPKQTPTDVCNSCALNGFPNALGENRRPAQPPAFSQVNRADS